MAKTEHNEKVVTPDQGFYRRQSDEIVIAFALESKEDAKGQHLTIQWMGPTIPGRMSTEKQVRVGVERGCYNASRKALQDQVDSERANRTH